LLKLIAQADCSGSSQYYLNMPQIVLADVITLESTQPLTQAVLCSNGWIQAVGTREELQTMAPQASILDFRGHHLTPGLTDAHVHLVLYGFSLERLDLSQTRSWREATRLIAERAAHLEPGTWLQGGGFLRSNWGLEGHPLAAWLDEVAPNTPVLIASRDGHALWVNSLALRLAGIHAGTPNPDGGVIVRDEQGDPSGTLLETAAALLRQAMPVPAFADFMRAAKAAAADLDARGFTCVHTMAAEPADCLRAILELEARQDMPLRIWASLPHADLEHIQALGLRGGAGHRVRMSGIKFFADGALGSRTAKMLEDYLGFPGERGVTVDSAETIVERGRLALELGFSPVAHAIGDAANRTVLDAFETLKPLAVTRGLRLRLEHAQHLHPEDVARFGKLGVIAGMQAIHLPGDTRNIDLTLGSTRARTSFAFRSLIESGATIALGSDAPIATPDPNLGFSAAIDRQDDHGKPWHPEQALSRLETLTGYTRNAAFAAGWETWYGQIAPGFAAEFTLWDGNPMLEVAKPLRTLKPGQLG
jgi:predicted amidohydrolase YtcJ